MGESLLDILFLGKDWMVKSNDNWKIKQSTLILLTPYYRFNETWMVYCLSSVINAIIKKYQNDISLLDTYQAMLRIS